MKISEITEGVAKKDPLAIEELYNLIKKKVCKDSWKHEDILHEIFLVVMNDIQKNKLIYPQALIGYSKKLFSRMIFRHLAFNSKFIHMNVHKILDSRSYFLKDINILGLLSRKNHARYREVLYRTFFLDQEVEEIRVAMGFQTCACVHTIRCLALARLRGLIRSKERRQLLLAKK